MRRWRVGDADWNHWPDGLTAEQSWPLMARSGVEGVEIGVYDVLNSPPAAAAWDVLEAHHGLPAVALLLSLPPQRWPLGALTGEPEAVAAQVRGCARLCAQRGWDVLGVWPGADPPGVPWDRLVEGLALAADAAAPHGVRLAVEYKPGTVVSSCGDALRLAQDVTGTGVLLDTGHAYAAGEEPAEAVRRLGGLLWHVHLGDAAVGAADDDLPLGRLHDFAPLVRALDEAGFAGVAAFDLYGAVTAGLCTGAAAARESMAHLRAAGLERVG